MLRLHRPFGKSAGEKKSTYFVRKASLFESVQTGFAEYPASYEMGTTVSDRGVKLATHYHLTPTTKVSGTIPPLRLYIHGVQSDRHFTLSVAVFKIVGQKGMNSPEMLH